MLLIRVDWSKITIAKATQVADFIAVCYDWNSATSKFDMKVYHFLTPKKDVDVALYAFNSLMSDRKRARRSIQRVVLITDGGPSDFHMKRWVHYEFDIARQLNVELEHIIMAPYHGDGPCDSAKSQAAQKLRNQLLANPIENVTIQTVATIFNTVVNHTATVVSLGDVVAYQEPQSMKDIRSCHRFVANHDNDLILGYDQSLLDVDAQEPKQWPF